MVNQAKQARGYFPVVGVGIYDDGLSSLPGNRTPVARGRAPRGKGGSKGGRTAGPSTAGKGSHGITSRAPEQPAAKLRKGGRPGQALRGGPAHGSSPSPGLCFLCGQPGHLARDCPNLGTGGTAGRNKRAFGTGGLYWASANSEGNSSQVDYAYAACCESSCCEAAPVIAAASAATAAAARAGGAWGDGNIDYGILDGGASCSCASFEIIQMIADGWEPLGTASSVQPNGGRAFLFGGGERTQSNTKAVVPNDCLTNGLGIHVVANPNTPFLLGLDTLREYGSVLGYQHDTVYSHVLERYIPSKVLSSGHIGIRVLLDPQQY